MSIWLTRAGSHGEYEQKFLSESRVYLTWDGLAHNLGALKSRGDLDSLLGSTYPDAKNRTRINWAGQIWKFAKEIQKGDLVAIPLKSQRAIQIGEVVGDYAFDAKAADPYYHSRQVKWLGEAIPRDQFDQDLLFSLGAFMTVCRIERNDAEARIKRILGKGGKANKAAVKVAPAAKSTELVEDEEGSPDFAELAEDQITKLISQRFKGHKLTLLIEGILQAQGYTTWRSPEGADGGVDILAGSGPLGFGSPRLCVEVKSGDDKVDRPTVDKLLGAMQKFNANEGLFVSWSGFKGNVQKELAQSFFRVRLWSQQDILQQLFASYERLDDKLKAEIPLQRIWALVPPEE